MTSILIKSIDEITRRDIDSLITSEVVESDQIEFKRELPSPKKGIDSWPNGNLGERAKRVVVDAIVAFANANGGVLVIGIDESDSKPPTASKIFPISGCNDLVESLKMVCRDCIQPQLPNLEIFAVETGGANCGVVILRTGKSHLAPHRNQLTKQCTIRRLNRVDDMTMQEIQNMTLNLSRGLKKLKNLLKERSKKFHKDLYRLESPAGKYGVRMTAAPVMEGIQFDRVFRDDCITSELEPIWHTVKYQNNPSKHLEFPSHFPLNHWRPILRGARAETPGIGKNTEFFGYQEIHSNGLVEYGWLGSGLSGSSGIPLPPDWFVTTFANLLIWGDFVRRQGNAPSMEYAVEVETYNSAENVCVGYRNFPTSVSPELRNLKYPVYPFNLPIEMSGLIHMFHRDLWNSLGRDETDDKIFEIPDFPSFGSNSPE